MEDFGRIQRYYKRAPTTDTAQFQTPITQRRRQDTHVSKCIVWDYSNCLHLSPHGVKYFFECWMLPRTSSGSSNLQSLLVSIHPPPIPIKKIHLSGRRTADNCLSVDLVPRRTGEYRKGVISASPLHQGVRRSVWDPETSRERIGDWGGPDGLGPLVCCRKALCHKAKRRVGV